MTNLNFKSRPARSVFVSDIHLGTRLSNARAFLAFLETVEPQFLYLVGDVLDGWSLTKKFYWPPENTRIVDRVLALQRRGTVVRITPGNHDDFLRRPLPMIDQFEMAEEFVHHAACGRRLWVTHGDLFDAMEVGGRRLSMFGARIFDQFTRVLPRRGLLWIRRSSKRIFSKPDRLHQRITEVATGRDVNGLIYGHTHAPRLAMEAGIVTGNCGDWIQHQSAIIEQEDGRLQLINEGQLISELPPQCEVPQLVKPNGPVT